MKRSTHCVTGRIGSACDRAVRQARSDHQVAVVQRIRDERARFVSHETLRAAQVVKERNHLVEIIGALVIDNRDAAQIQTIVPRGCADLFVVAHHRDARDAASGRIRGGGDRARIVAFRQDDVLRP